MQSHYFDDKADIFVAPIPEDIQDLTKSIVLSAKLGKASRVLDVGTGAGVLVGHFLEEGLSPENIVGCDLSAEMLRNAQDRYPKVTFWQGDIVDLAGSVDRQLPERLQAFDAVFFNACFGNMWDQEETLSGALKLLAPGGKIVISHPLGNKFVDSLHRNEPHIVPHLLPDCELVSSWRDRLGFEVEHFEDRGDFYLVILVRRE
jgi:Methylase involved in ubiquinone/menaquinone biosynthesis